MEHAEISGFRTSVRRALARIRGGQMTPQRLAMSVGVGVFIGTLPLYGVHLPLCALVSVPLRLNLYLVYAAAHVSIPPLIPLLLYGSYQLGVTFLPGSAPLLMPEKFDPAAIANLGATVLVGSVLLGVVLGGTAALTAWLVGVAIKRSREGEEAQSRRAARKRHFEQVCARYESAPAAHRYYVSLKLRTDPLARRLVDCARALPEGAVLVDAGCGRGQFSFLLASAVKLRRIVGFDLDPAKVEVAQQAAAGRWCITALPPLPPCSFRASDLTSAELPECDVLLLLDVLHYLPADQQAACVQRCAEAIKPGGTLFIRETGGGRGAGWARLLERLGVRLAINRGHTLDFCEPTVLIEQLKSHGFQLCESKQEGPLDNVLMTFRRHPPAAVRSAGRE